MIKIIHILYCCKVIICMYIIYRQNMLILVTQCLHKDMICSVVFILAVKIKEQIQSNIALTFIFLILTKNESENLFIHSLLILLPFFFQTGLLPNFTWHFLFCYGYVEILYIVCIKFSLDVHIQINRTYFLMKRILKFLILFFFIAGVFTLSGASC